MAIFSRHALPDHARRHPERETLELATAALLLGFAPGDAAAKPEARPTALIRSRWMER